MAETRKIAFKTEITVPLIAYFEFDIALDAITAQNTVAMRKMSDVIGNKITNCNFKNLSYRAINIVGTKKAETDKHWWQRQPIDGSYDCEISDSVFYNIITLSDKKRTVKRPSARLKVLFYWANLLEI